MNSTYSRTAGFLLIVMFLAAAGGCAGKWRGRLEQSATAQPKPSASATEIPELLPVYFELGSSKLRWEQPYLFPDHGLEEHVAWLRTNVSVWVLIEGHGDHRESVALTLRRAKAVRDYLLSRGIPRQQLRVSGLGNERPIAWGKNEMAWAQNRRVEFMLVAK